MSRSFRLTNAARPQKATLELTCRSLQAQQTGSRARIIERPFLDDVAEMARIERFWCSPGVAQQVLGSRTVLWQSTADDLALREA
jgi:hypothetical protein